MSLFFSPFLLCWRAATAASQGGLRLKCFSARGYPPTVFGGEGGGGGQMLREDKELRNARQPANQFAAWGRADRVCVFYLGDIHAAGRWGWDQKPSQTLPPLTYKARSAATVAAPSSTQRMPEPFKRSPMILQPASVGPLPMSQPR
jgi:hypothetical protein